MPCKRCQEHPSFHSFQSLGKTSHGKAIVYSKPCLAVEKKFEESSIPNYFSHMDDASKESWIWIFDSGGLAELESPNFFTMRKFYLEMEQRYDKVLQHILILNLNWKVNLLLGFIKPFLSEQSQKRLVVIEHPLELVKYGIQRETIHHLFPSQAT